MNKLKNFLKILSIFYLIFLFLVALPFISEALQFKLNYGGQIATTLSKQHFMYELVIDPVGYGSPGYGFALKKNNLNYGFLTFKRGKNLSSYLSHKKKLHKRDIQYFGGDRKGSFFISRSNDDWLVIIDIVNSPQANPLVAKRLISKINPQIGSSSNIEELKALLEYSSIAYERLVSRDTWEGAAHFPPMLIIVSIFYLLTRPVIIILWLYSFLIALSPLILVYLIILIPPILLVVLIWLRMRRK